MQDILKLRLDTVSTNNLLDISKKQLNSAILIKGNDLAPILLSVTKHIHRNLQDVVSTYLKKLYVVDIPSPLVLNISNDPRYILLNIRPLRAISIHKINPNIIVNTILGGSVFYKDLIFSEKLLYNYLYSLFIRCLGKKYGLLVPGRKELFIKILGKYCYMWRTGAQSIDMLVTELRQLFVVNKGILISNIIRITGIEGLPMIEDYYRLIAMLVAGTLSSHVYRHLQDINKQIAANLINLYLNSKTVIK